ncbi:D-alanyl-D-alanine carboxypeptidase [Lysinibacillus sp. RC46]
MVLLTKLPKTYQTMYLDLIGGGLSFVLLFFVNSVPIAWVCELFGGMVFPLFNAQSAANLLLVNSKNPVHNESIISDVINLYANKELVKGYKVFNSEIFLSEDIASKFSDMVLDAEEDGVSSFLITSGFRRFDEQTKLYKEMGSKRALPAGFSEHNLGLSLDMGSTQGKMEVAPEGEWIAQNAWKYGFTLRYPEDKTDITGIMNEPWHIRFVGLPHSAIMKEKNYVLEEYLDFLKAEKHISATVNGQKYEVFYYPVTENTTINVPANLRYEVSGNNIDGVIVTVFPDTV